MSVQELITQIGTQRIAAFFLVLARVTPLFILAPLFNSRLIPARVKGTIAVGLSIGLSPIVARDVTIPLDTIGLAGLIGKELIVGLAFAFALGALFAAVQVAGSFLDTLVGFSYGGLVDPINGNQSAVITQLYGMIGTLVFIVIDGDAWVIRGMAHTYDIVGLTQWPNLSSLVAGVTVAFAGIFVAAIQVAGPVVLALIVTDAAFGVVSRVVPQLNVFQVGFPAKVLVGLLLIGVSLPFVAQWLSGELQADVGQALSTLKVA